MNSFVQTMICRILLYSFLAIAMLAVMPDNSEATHFRSGTISWVPTENPNEVEFRMKTVWRGNFSNWQSLPIGATVNGGSFFFGDGTGVQISHTVVNRNIQENWVEFEAVFKKQYSGTGPFTAFFRICCRISNSGNANDTVTMMEVLVDPSSGNSSPVSNQFPLVTVPRGSASSFLISAADPDGDQLRFRLANPSESNFNTNPPGLTIDQQTGLVTWDNTGLSDADLWSIQVFVEDLDENGNVKSKIPVEFVMEIIEAQADLPPPPQCEVAPIGPFSSTINNPILFDVTGIAGDPSVTVSLAGIGFPSGSSMNPTLPEQGTGTVTSQFSWTPSAAQTGSYVLTFSATDQYGQQTQCGATMNITSNQPPVADAGEDQTVTCPACDIQLDGSGSFDPDGDPLTYTWTYGEETWSGADPVIKLPLGEHTITLTVDDGRGGTDSDQVTITVVNTPPVADAGPDQLLECPACDIVLDGSGSFDADGHELTYTWTYGEETWTGVNPEIKLPIGVHTITLTVEDECEATATDEVTITVADTTPPDLVTVSDPYILWPPNHQYHTFYIADFIVSVSDDCDENVSLDDVVITRATSDEPGNQTGSNNGRGRNGGGGDGNTTNDIVIAADGQSIDLRAERLGGGNGRVYTVYVGVMDASGNMAESSFEVHVPQNPNRAAINDGPAYEVTGLTPSAPAAPAMMAAAGDQVTLTQAQPGALQSETGITAAADLAESESLLPRSFGLQQNYPNPFNPSTVISYQVPAENHVTIEVFDVTGRRIATLVNETRNAGNHQVTFNTGNLNSGVYLYRMIAGQYSEVRRMTLIK